MRRFWTAALATFGALAALATAPAYGQNEIVLGLATAATGALKSSGETTGIAVDIAVDEINAKGGVNGKKIRVVKFDTGSDPKQAVVAANKFIQDDNALAIIGPFSTGEAAAAFPVGERLGIVQIPNASSAPGLTKGKSYAWRLTEDEEKQFVRLLETMKRKGVPMKRAEIFYVTDERIAQVVGTTLMPKYLKQYGVEIGEPIGFSNQAFDIAPQATKAMQSKPDIIAVAGLVGPAAKVLKEMRRQGFTGRMIGSQLFADPNAEELFGTESDGTLFTSGFWKDHDADTKEFTKKFNNRLSASSGGKKPFPHHVDAQAYDIVYLLKQAMEKAKVTGDRAKLAPERTAIRDALKGISFNGITGKNVCFDADNDAELPGFIIEMKGGKWKLFDMHPPDKCG